MDEINSNKGAIKKDEKSEKRENSLSPVTETVMCFNQMRIEKNKNTKEENSSLEMKLVKKDSKRKQTSEEDLSIIERKKTKIEKILDEDVLSEDLESKLHLKNKRDEENTKETTNICDKKSETGLKNKDDKEKSKEDNDFKWELKSSNKKVKLDKQEENKNKGQNNNILEKQPEKDLNPKIETFNIKKNTKDILEENKSDKQIIKEEFEKKKHENEDSINNSTKKAKKIATNETSMKKIKTEYDTEDSLSEEDKMVFKKESVENRRYSSFDSSDDSSSDCPPKRRKRSPPKVASRIVKIYSSNDKLAASTSKEIPYSNSAQYYETHGPCEKITVRRPAICEHFVPPKICMFGFNDCNFQGFLRETNSLCQNTNRKIGKVSGNLFSAPKDFALAHCVSADFKMSAGIAVTFRARFGQIPTLLSQNQDIGGLAVLNIDGRFIYYLVTKEKSFCKPTLYTLWLSLQQLRKHVIANNVKKLAMPTIGCGLDKLNWFYVELMIEYIFQNVDIDIKVYFFE